MYELIIIGGGPAGISAATMALNQRVETLIIAEHWGGQTTYEMELELTQRLDVRDAFVGEMEIHAKKRLSDDGRDLGEETEVTTVTIRRAD